MAFDKVRLTIDRPAVEVNSDCEWSIAGKITNDDDTDAYITTVTTVLVLPAEVVSKTEDKYTGIDAFFPTGTLIGTMQRRDVEVVRIPAGSSYGFTWRINDQSLRRSNARGLRSGSRQLAAITRAAWRCGHGLFAYLHQHLFFRPGVFHVMADVHLYSRSPSLGDVKTRHRANRIVTGEQEIDVQLPLPHQIVGSIIGGLLAYVILQKGWNGIHLFSALQVVAMSAIGMVIISRLSRSDLPISIKIRDVWGGIATGVVLCLIGTSWIEKLGHAPSPPPVNEQRHEPVHADGANQEKPDGNADTKSK